VTSNKMLNLVKKELIRELLLMGIKSTRVLNAIEKVKREEFVSDELKKMAYDNNALPIDCNQTISQPYTVAFMTELLNVKEGDKVLEIGTGSGYQAAILKELGADVYSIERIAELSEKAKQILEKLGYDVKIKTDDGTKGWAEYSPFDGIIVTAAAPHVPQSLVTQLKIDGRLVIPVGDKYTQKIVLVKKIIEENQEKVTEKHYPDFRFVPLIGEEGWDS